jgi:multiple sugar transport system permease protein
MAASVMSVVPIVVLFFFTQRTFIEGIAMTGLKG